MEEKNKSGLSISAFVLGIVSIVSNLFWYICWPTGILAIVFGAKSIKRSGSKLAKSGLITGIIGLSISLLIYIGLILIVIKENAYYY